jgi:predicted nucleic acid-binding protein
MLHEPTLTDLLNENWPAFREWKPAADTWLEETARGMPPSFHADLRAALLSALLDQVVEERRQPLQLHLVIDSGIIVTDAFRVGRGLSSTTPRLLQSPFVQVYAPAKAWEEVPRKIQEKHPEAVDVRLALQQGELVLQQIHRVETTAPASVQRAAALIGRHSPEDVDFLAVALDTDADAIVSFDKRAYDQLQEVDRWTMKDGSQAILRYESGTLSMGFAGAAAIVLSQAIEVILTGFVQILAEVFAAVLSIVNWLATRTVAALENIPGWAVFTALAIGASLLAAYALIPEFREWIDRGISKASAILAMASQRVYNAINGIWASLKPILTWLWTNVVRPLAKGALLAAGILLSHVEELILECERQATDAAP